MSPLRLLEPEKKVSFVKPKRIGGAGGGWEERKSFLETITLPEYETPTGVRYGPPRLKPAVKIREFLGAEPKIPAYIPPKEEKPIITAFKRIPQTAEDIMDIASVGGILINLAKTGFQGVKQIPRVISYLRTKAPTEAQYWAKFTPQELLKMNKAGEATKAIRRQIAKFPKGSPQHEEAANLLVKMRKRFGVITGPGVRETTARMMAQEAQIGIGAIPKARLPVPITPRVTPPAPITPAILPKPITKPAIALKQLPLLTGKKRIGKLVALPRGETFELVGLPRKVGPPARVRIAEEQRRIQEVRLRAEGRIPTPEQIREAHIIAREKALITPEGKTTPGYRALARGMTGKTSMKKMTQPEAESFITSLKGISEPRYIKGKLVPPSIPRVTTLARPEFFQQRFRKPTPAKLATSQTRYAELLGIKKLVAPMEMGKQVLDLEYAKGAHQIDTAVKELKKAKIAPKQMTVMLNTLEEAPVDISEQGKKVFNYFRDLTRDVRVRENEIRATLELPPIEYRQAYFRHIADKMSQEIIDGKYPLPEGLKYWSEQTVGKKVYNPMEMQRKLSDDLLEKFSSDLPYVMKSMLWTGLKEVHLSIPKNILHKELGILSKDKVVYKNLAPQEQKLYDAQMTMPAETKKWLLDYVNIVLSGRQTALDRSVNLWITDTPIKTVLNSILKPFGEHIGQKPVSDMLSKVSKLPIYGAMGGVNPRQLIRNKFQTLQNIALYGVKNTIKGYTPTSSYPTLEKLKTDSLFKRSYSGFEDLPIGMMGKIEKAGLAPYQWSAVSNVSQAMNSSYHWTADNIQNPKKKHLGWADPKRTYTEPKDFFYPSEQTILLKEMEYGAHTTQYQYIGLGMPEVFRYKALAPLTRLQSWWMNHWFVFHREAATRAFTGHAGYDPKLKITLGDRVNYLKYLIIGGLILTNLGYYRSYLLGTAPTGLPPTGQLMMGLYEYFTNLGDSNWEKGNEHKPKTE